MALGGVALLAGCADGMRDPVTWWHDFEGGRIDSPRPAVPGANAPYPNLGAVPSRPQVDDAAARGRIANQLVADRANANYATQSALPALPATPVQPAQQAGAPMSAALTAADRPEAPTPPPRPAPVGKVASTTLAPPATPAPTTPVPDAPMPAVPDRPPAPPVLAGVAQATAPTPLPLAPPPAPVVAPIQPGVPVTVAFAAGSAELPTAAVVGLRALAAQRGSRPIAVSGYGEAPAGDTAAQAAALPLAWQRAGAIAQALQAAGVPEASLSVTAEAAGHGGVARIAE